MKDSPQFSLDKIGGGQLLDLAKRGMDEVMNNCTDPNTEVKKPRKLVLEIIAVPNERNRVKLRFDFKMKTSLAPRLPGESEGTIVYDENGDPMLYEYDVDQIRLPIDIDEDLPEMVIDEATGELYAIGEDTAEAVPADTEQKASVVLMERKG